LWLYNYIYLINSSKNAQFSSFKYRSICCRSFFFSLDKLLWHGSVGKIEFLIFWVVNPLYPFIIYIRIILKKNNRNNFFATRNRFEILTHVDPFETTSAENIPLNSHPTYAENTIIKPPPIFVKGVEDFPDLSWANRYRQFHV